MLLVLLLVILVLVVLLSSAAGPGGPGAGDAGPTAGAAGAGPSSDHTTICAGSFFFTKSLLFEWFLGQVMDHLMVMVTVMVLVLQRW